MEFRLTRRQFVKDLAVGLTSASLLAGSNHSVFGSENKGDTMKDSSFIQTVRGRIKPDELGLTLIHEHVIVDFIGADKVNKDRYDADEVFEVMLPYLKEIRELGVTGFGDCAPMFLGRDPELLARLSEAADMHIITNTGLYKEPYLPEYAFEKTADELAKIWIDEAENGIEGTGIKPGFIKIAVNPGNLIPVQQKIVRAAARTSRATGLAIASHTGHPIAAMETLDILEEEGVSLNNYIFVHADTDKDHDVAQRGGWVEYDNISEQKSARYIQLIKGMLEKGHEDNLLLSQDAGWYHVGEPKGGNIRDFAYLVKEFVPLMKNSGIDQNTVDKLLIENPAQALSIREGVEDSKGVSPKGKAISTFGRIK
ncbi:phosphotriesterase [Candidatus Poribacteria bacterium]